MDKIRIFEEVRFILELVAAELLFLIPFARKKEKGILKGSIGSIILFIFAVINVPVQYQISHSVGMKIYVLLIPAGYIFLTVFSLVICYACFHISISDLLYIGIIGYTLQHIEYIVINELIGLKVMPYLREKLFLYFIICSITTVVLYAGVYAWYHEKLVECEGILYEDGWKNRIFLGVFFFLLLAGSFAYQAVFQYAGNGVVYLGAVLDLLCSMLILFTQYSILRACRLNREKGIIHQALYERQRQYELARNSADVINRKCHDLKHQIRALRASGVQNREEYLTEMEKAVNQFQTFADTENEILNTILTDKGMYCENHGIRLSVIADGRKLGFMQDMDIYALLGNALDNAIECVEKYENPEKRIISLNISGKNEFLSIEIDNYCEENLKFQNGLPVTTKHETAYHGFGMKSIRYIAEKYGGVMCAEMEACTFTLRITIPVL